MTRKIKPGLELKIKVREKIYIRYPAKSVLDAQQVRHILSPPDGPIPYSHFTLYRDSKQIEF